MAGKIFINYRRDDSIGTAGRLHDRLAQAFGRDQLFMDVDHIPAGVDFVGHLNVQVAACDVFLAIIGPNWLDAKDESGRRRLDKPDDFVTIEIAAALARNIRVIPVMIEGARMPKAEEVPDSIKPLVRRHAVEVRHAQFGRDAEALVEKVSEALGGKPAAPGWRRAGMAAGALSVAVALFFVGWFGLHRAGLLPWPPWAVQRDADKGKGAAEADANRPEPAVLRNQRGSDEAEQQRWAAEAKNERQTAAAAAEAEAKRRSEEQQRLAAAAAAEQQGLAAAAAAEAEAKRRSEEAEQQALAARRAEQERQAAAAAQASARSFALVRQGNADASNGAYDRAIANFSDAIRFDPRNALAFYYRGLTYAKKGDNDRAIVDYSEALRIDPTRASPYYDRGVAYEKKRDNDRAIADYSEAIRLDPKNASAFNNRGVLYQTRGDNNRAIADYNEAIRLQPDAARYFCNRAMAKMKIKDASAKADIAKARQLDASVCR
jgi:tetratricopeptide (TPR) repeat protein